MYNRPLERIKALLELAIKKQDERPSEETFAFFGRGSLGLPEHPLFKDSRGLVIAGQKIALETRGAFTLEYTPGTALTVTDLQSGRSERYVFHIDDPDKLREYYAEVVRELETKRINFALDTRSNFAQLYINGESSLHYPMNKGALRYKLMYFLAKHKKPIPANVLAKHFDVTVKVIRKTVEQTRGAVHKKLNSPRRSIFYNDGVSGYQIDNVKVIG